MVFTFPVYSVAFDYEIFSNATCPTGSGCGSHWPDFTFEADDQAIFRELADVPPVLGYTHSPRSGPTRNELAPQYLGQSGQWLFSTGVTKLEFIDWPVRIGIDNLVVNTSAPAPATSVPVPGTLLLAGTGLLAAVAGRRARKRG